MKKPASVVVVIVALALGGWRIWKMDQEARAVKAQQEMAKTAATAPVKAESAGSAAKTGVRKLSKEERRVLREKIGAAITQSRGANGANGSTGATGTPHGSAGTDDEPIIPLEKVGKQAQDALRAAIPILAECYQSGGSGSAAGKTAIAQMTMISDPELGTVIDTSRITGGDGAPIAPAVDDCLRNAIESLALPPLGVPGKLALQYSFRFDS